MLKTIAFFVYILFFASASHVQAQNLEQDFRRATEAFAQKNYIEAARGFRELSAQNDQNSQYNYALLLSKGVGTPKDVREALYWAWRARANGVEKAVDLTAQIANALSNAELEELQNKLLDALMPEASKGFPIAISGVAKVYFYVKQAPDYEDAYTWALVAQAFGQDDVQDLIDEAEKNLSLDLQLQSQKNASDTFGTIVQTQNIDKE